MSHIDPTESVTRSELRLISSWLHDRFVEDDLGRIEGLRVRATRERVPRFCFARTRLGNLWRFRNDLPTEVVRRLVRYAGKEAALTEGHLLPERVKAMENALGEGVGHGETAVDVSSEAAFRRLAIYRAGGTELVTASRVGDEHRHWIDLPDGARLLQTPWSMRPSEDEWSAEHLTLVGDAIEFS